MSVLVVNAGSSTLKYALVGPGRDEEASGVVERIGEDGASVTHRAGGDRCARFIGPRLIARPRSIQPSTRSCCRREICGPCRFDGSSGSPYFHAPKAERRISSASA